MTYCTFCGALLPDEATFCTSCGRKLNECDDSVDGGTTVLSEDFDEGNVINNATASGNPEVYANNDSFVDSSSQNASEGFQQPYNPSASNASAYQASVQPAAPFIPSSVPDQFANNPLKSYGSQENLSYEEFYEQFASKNTKSNIKATGIIAIITVVLSFAALGMGNLLSILDIVVYAVLAFFILKKKHWYFTLALACYSSLFTIVGLVLSGMPSGIVASIIAIVATVKGKKLADAYKNYQETNQIPNEQI